jgi:hypothetical protein
MASAGGALSSAPAVPPPLPQTTPPERNPGILRLPSSAAAVLARVRVLSCDCGVLFCNAAMFRGATRLQHLLLRWGRQPQPATRCSHLLA